MPDTRSQIAVPTVAIETHGCKLNQSDSFVFVRELETAGFKLVSRDEPADVYIVNTCTVTHIADRKGRQALRSARRLNPNATIVATGCYAERDPDALKALNEIDLVVGNTGKYELVKKIVEMQSEQIVPCSTGDDSVIDSSSILRSRPMIKIQEGCNQICAYCIVPKVRGRERSIHPGKIISEIKRYSLDGCKEIVLTGTQLGSYGFDLEDIDLPGLIKQILLNTDVPRVRVSSLQPQEISDNLLDLWADSRLCPHFHIPLQSASDRILKMMRRRYTNSQYSNSINKIRNKIQDASITTDVIVGFPQETKEEFEETYNMCDQVGFTDVHVFPYSERPGTSAVYFGNKVDAIEKTSRVRRLLNKCETHSSEYRKKFLGTARPVLWERQTYLSGVVRWQGLTDNYLKVITDDPKDLGNQITFVNLSTLGDDGIYEGQICN